MAFQKGHLQYNTGRTWFKPGHRMIPWNKGKHLSEKHKKKIRKTLKNRIFTDEHRKKLSLAMTGKKLSEQHKKKLSTNHWTKNSNAKKIRKKLSELHKGRHNSPKTEFKKGHIPWNKDTKGVMKPNKGSFRKGNIPPLKDKTLEEVFGIKKAKKMKEKISKAKKGKIYEEIYGVEKANEIKKIRSLAMEGKNNSFYGKHHTKESIEKILKNRKYVIPNKAEIKLNNLLQENFPNEFKYVGDGEVVFGGKNPDFINCNGKKLIIELFGRPFHDPNYKFKFKGVKIKWHQQEAGTKMHYSQYGFKTLVIWDDELKNESKVIEEINNFVNYKKGGK